jgi:hypothetical protein
MKVLRLAFRATRKVAFYGVDVVFPAFGIPRPLSYLALLFWFYFMGTLVYRIATHH